MAISKRLRFEILARDGHTCRYCGAKAPDVALRVDHVLAVALGGTDDPSNLCAACHDCNAGKSSMTIGGPVVADIADAALLWAAAKSLAFERAEARLDHVDTLIARFAAAWRSWSDDEGEIPQDADWESGVRHWLARGLTVEFLERHIATAMQARVRRRDQIWRYYCGVIWRSLDGIEDEAQRALEVMPQWGSA